jgi:alpha,alpha-trehalase
MLHSSQRLGWLLAGGLVACSTPVGENAQTAENAQTERPPSTSGASDAPSSLSAPSRSTGSLSVPRGQALDALCQLLADKDRDCDRRITIEDQSLPSCEIGQRCVQRSASAWPYAVKLGEHAVRVERTHQAAQLATELVVGLSGATGPNVELSLDRVHADPASYLEGRIEDHYWNALTRTIEPRAEPLLRAVSDSKVDANSGSAGAEWCRDRIPRCDASTAPEPAKAEPSAPKSTHYVYVPASDAKGIAAFTKATLPESISVLALPQGASAQWVADTTRADRHGLLVLALDADGHGRPYVVPGGRFNEMYGWDSFFIVWGLMQDPRYLDLGRAMVDNHAYEIRHYGKILNANRSYYLTRSQPPLLTSMLDAVWQRSTKSPADLDWLRRSLGAAMAEYEQVWATSPHRTKLCDGQTCLARYYGEGQGQPPEVEADHFTWFYQQRARDTGRCSAPTSEAESQLKFIRCAERFAQDYREQKITDPRIDEFFTHDRCVRESGHDTTYRWFEAGQERCADYATVDLNSLLFKYEIDIARLLKDHFAGELDGQTSQRWCERAVARAQLVQKYLFNGGAGLFFDYDTKNARQSSYLSATTLYPLWASAPNPCGVALLTQAQADEVSDAALRELEAPGGLLATAVRSQKRIEPPSVIKASADGKIETSSAGRQWEAPNGWAPHQMIAWQGLSQWGHADDAQRLVYRWLYMIVANAANYHGTVPEKFDVVARTHEVFQEYGNVNTDFAYIAEEGFGWMNASYLVGLGMLSDAQRAALRQRIAPERLDFVRETGR